MTHIFAEGFKPPTSGDVLSNFLRLGRLVLLLADPGPGSNSDLAADPLGGSYEMEAEEPIYDNTKNQTQMLHVWNIHLGGCMG